MKKSHTDSRGTFIRKQKRVLEAKQSECLKQRQQAVNGLTAIDSDELKDSTDLANAVMYQETSGKQANGCAKEYTKVSQAILNIANDTYGICNTCEQEISIKRLEAVPWATKCVTCQKTEEEATELHR